MKTYQVKNTNNGTIYTITENYDGENATVSWNTLKEGCGEVGYLLSTVHELLARGSWALLPELKIESFVGDELGVYRPVLESRKAGKIRVELVDDGFPLALRAVAHVMTWAQTAKGYKDHDWQNLPDAEIQLAAAASRHRTDHIKQRLVEGGDIKDCVDPESALLHKAHEAFGVLAQLELMLRGKIS